MNEENEGYYELTRMIEHLHRRLLDVVRNELNHQGIKDVSPVQALLLTKIRGEEIHYRDLVERGYYLGSNVSYNIKKLADHGYLRQGRLVHDRRATLLSLTEKGTDLCARLRDLERKCAQAFTENLEANDDLEKTCRLLRRLEHSWSDLIHFPRS